MPIRSHPKSVRRVEGLITLPRPTTAKDDWKVSLQNIEDHLKDILNPQETDL